jgi:hypothetical protein
MPDPTEYAGPRGLRGYLDLKTCYGHHVEVKESSNALVDRCWLRVTGGACDIRGCALLTYQQVESVRDALSTWLEEHEDIEESE